MEKKREALRKAVSLLVLIYGIYMTYVSTLLMDMFSSGWFEDPFNLALAKIMFPLSIICVICGVGLVLLKRWGSMILFIICPLYLSIYISSLIYNLVKGNGFGMDVRGVILFLLPILFFIYFIRRQNKKRLITLP